MNLDDYYVCYKMDEKRNMIMYVNDEEDGFTYSLESSMKFISKEDALEAIAHGNSDEEPDCEIYTGCSIGKVVVTMTKEE